MLWKKCSFRWMLFLAILIIIVDQISKYVVVTSFSDIVVFNEGAAFGLMQGFQWLFILIGIIVVIFLFHFFKEYPYVEIGLLLGGVVGNLIDRVLLGHVVDFITIGWWPSFNIADSASTVAVVLILLRMLLDRFKLVHA